MAAHKMFQMAHILCDKCLDLIIVKNDKISCLNLIAQKKELKEFQDKIKKNNKQPCQTCQSH
jgi:hypothetical protein